MTLRALTSGLLLGAVLAVSACGEAGKPSASAAGDMARGAAEGAKVTVVEYASPACPACAAWQAEVGPAFEAKYVANDKVRFVFREMVTGNPQIASAGFLLARCAGEDKYFDVLHQIMASQGEMAAGSPRPVLLRIAQGAGLSEQQFTTCISDPDALNALDARNRKAAADGIGHTPTFLVNGVPTPDNSLSTLSAAIDAELAKP